MELDYGVLVAAFLEEASELFMSMERAILALEESSGAEGEHLRTIFRVTHTIKGNALTLRFTPLKEFAHSLEDLLELAVAGALPLDAPFITLLLRSLDAIRRLVVACKEGASELPAAELALLQEIRARVSGPRGDAGRLGQPSGAQPAVMTSAPPQMRSLRLTVDKLDRLVDLVGEIAIARGRLGQALSRDVQQTGSEDALGAHREMDQLFLDLQDQVMRLRMVPLGPLFFQQRRLVRDLAERQGKDVRLMVEGEQVELDTSVVEQLREPLVHLLRNAVDHGIESAEERVRAGKPEQATIGLKAYSMAGAIVIEVSDDGRGLQKERLRERALALGALAPEQIGLARVDELIFTPGLSTAQEVTDVSGRGVGMDAVRRSIEAVRGTIDVRSEEGQGTTFILRLPLTLAIIRGFSVGAGKDVYVIPVEAVQECIELPSTHHRGDASRGVVHFRGHPLPYLRLREHFGMSGPPGNRENVVVLRHEDQWAGLAVDELHGEGQVVIKPLGELFKAVPGIAGSTVLGDGRVGLVLDVPALMAQAAGTAARS